MKAKIGIIGSGPMAIYLLHYLVSTPQKTDITIFEKSATAGLGMPYDPDLNADYMLCNAFSREIPSLTIPLIEWLKQQPKRDLSEWELSYHDLSARAFYPRVLIGEYLQAQFEAQIDLARRVGHKVTVKTQCRVDDIIIKSGEPLNVAYESPAGLENDEYDFVVIATGHSWPEVPAIDGVELVSPWPYTKLTSLRDETIGVLGASLSAIDIVVAIGHARGEFHETGAGVSWLPTNSDDALSITMVSRTGIMPEGDFYYAYPYERLRHITVEAIDAEIEKGPKGLLERSFGLLLRELDAAEPDYLGRFPAEARTIDGFKSAYFAQRREFGGLAAVKRDLAKARASLAQKETVAHRYVLLRAHEVFDRILRELCEKDYERFSQSLMPVFADCYAAVPHLSLARIVALYDAGVLKLVATADGSEFRQGSDGDIEVETEDGLLRFAKLIDARGQSSAGLSALPFAGVSDALCEPDQPLLFPFELDVKNNVKGRLFCLALPQILEKYPFSQGLAECANHARGVAHKILSALADAEA